MKYKKVSIVEAEQVTNEAVKAHLFDEKPLPAHVWLASANYHKADRKIFSARLIMIDHADRRYGINIGDWVCTRENGTRFLCAPDTFAQLYTPTEEPQPERAK